MNITSAKYLKQPPAKDTNTHIILILDNKDDAGDLIYVPMNTANRHYQAILLWAAIDGNSIEAAD